jgi:hypothetical protein
MDPISQGCIHLRYPRHPRFYFDSSKRAINLNLTTDGFLSGQGERQLASNVMRFGSKGASRDVRVMHSMTDALHAAREGATQGDWSYPNDKRFGGMGVLEIIGSFRNRRGRGESLRQNIRRRKNCCANYRSIDIGANCFAGSAQLIQQKWLPSENSRSIWSTFCGRGNLAAMFDVSVCEYVTYIYMSVGQAF